MRASISTGRLSQWRTVPKRLFDIPPSAFVPQPKITSSVVHFSVLAEPVAPAELRDLKTVVFGSGGDSMTALLGGHVDVSASAPSAGGAASCAWARPGSASTAASFHQRQSAMRWQLLKVKG